VIEQVGSAEELYRRPASVFVARFIGRSNLLAATVTGAGADRVALSIAGQPHDVAHPGAGFAAGAAVLANIRPEAIAIGAPGGGLAGTVRARTYLGEKIEYEVEVAGQMLQVVRFNPPPAERFAVDDAVSVRLPHEGVQLLSGEAP
jgi:iron(III) transport system ATP-binding protein